jgi:hypothetical protein
MTTARHLILRAGAIGLATFDALRRRGETVRLITRSGRARGAPTTSRSPGATPATPPAPQRERLIPRPAGAALASVEATAARLVSMDNVSLYRRARRHPHTESRAYDAPTTKGQLRCVWRGLIAAHRASVHHVPSVHASRPPTPSGPSRALPHSWPAEHRAF